VIIAEQAPGTALTAKAALAWHELVLDAVSGEFTFKVVFRNLVVEIAWGLTLRGEVYSVFRHAIAVEYIKVATISLLFIQFIVHKQGLIVRSGIATADGKLRTRAPLGFLGCGIDGGLQV
jgi:hypothetical protein